jgi:hypothetical protein
MVLELFYQHGTLRMEQTYSPEEVEFAVSAIENAAAKAGVTGDVVYNFSFTVMYWK